MSILTDGKAHSEVILVKDGVVVLEEVQAHNVETETSHDLQLTPLLSRGVYLDLEVAVPIHSVGSLFNDQVDVREVHLPTATLREHAFDTLDVV